MLCTCLEAGALQSYQEFVSDIHLKSSSEEIPMYAFKYHVLYTARILLRFYMLILHVWSPEEEVL